MCAVCSDVCISRYLHKNSKISEFQNQDESCPPETQIFFLSKNPNKKVLQSRQNDITIFRAQCVHKNRKRNGPYVLFTFQMVMNDPTLSRVSANFFFQISRFSSLSPPFYPVFQGFILNFCHFSRFLGMNVCCKVSEICIYANVH